MNIERDVFNVAIVTQYNFSDFSKFDRNDKIGVSVLDNTSVPFKGHAAYILVTADDGHGDDNESAGIYISIEAAEAIALALLEAVKVNTK